MAHAYGGQPPPPIKRHAPPRASTTMDLGNKNPEYTHDNNNTAHGPRKHTPLDLKHSQTKSS